MFCKMPLEPRTMKRSDKHQRNSQCTKYLTVFNNQGIQHDGLVEFCCCESEGETLLRSNLWPCSPTSPRVAVSIELSELLRVLCLEKHVSTEGFCNALEYRYHRTPGQKAKVKKLSRILLQEVFEAYRHHVYQLQHMQDLDADYCISEIDSECCKQQLILFRWKLWLGEAQNCRYVECLFSASGTIILQPSRS
ncbi:uncharacterized protein LOC143465512 [Clavelina lepadiformis]|uniref:uncharacterized protein LOC143465512 n=1 Tax=Clavelina lepadiformis TaxID=159417 RepID=UPI004042AC79